MATGRACEGTGRLEGGSPEQPPAPSDGVNDDTGTIVTAVAGLFFDVLLT